MLGTLCSFRGEGAQHQVAKKCAWRLDKNREVSLLAHVQLVCNCMSTLVDSNSVLVAESCKPGDPCSKSEVLGTIPAGMNCTKYRGASPTP